MEKLEIDYRNESLPEVVIILVDKINEIVDAINKLSVERTLQDMEALQSYQKAQCQHEWQQIEGSTMPIEICKKCGLTRPITMGNYPTCTCENKNKGN